MSHFALPDLLSALGALALVLGLIVLLRFGARFVGPGRPGQHAASLRVGGRLALDGRRRLYLIEAGAGQALVLTGGASDVMLPWPQQPEERP